MGFELFELFLTSFTSRSNRETNQHDISEEQKLKLML